MDPDSMKKRTKAFSLRVLKLVEALPPSRTANVIGNQLLKSGTSVGANYRAACRGRSKRDFISKVGIALEEADETLYWMELLLEAELFSGDRLSPLMQEANEFIAILTASIKTARRSIDKS